MAIVNVNQRDKNILILKPCQKFNSLVNDWIIVNPNKCLKLMSLFQSGIAHMSLIQI